MNGWACIVGIQGIGLLLFDDNLTGKGNQQFFQHDLVPVPVLDLPDETIWKQQDAVNTCTFFLSNSG